jgi:ABC-type dipeptide/oligopeptide/nickel transport system permease component
VYSLPTFWLATLAAMFLTTRFYGLKIFPEVGLGNAPVGATIVESLWVSLPHFILPIVCMTIHPIAVIARQMQAVVQDVLKKDFILTAKAKGLSQKHVIWRHAVRNSLTPMATLLAAMIPSLVTGAFAVELIFNLNGMGQVTVNALTGGDWSVVFAVLMLVSAVVLLGNLVSDVMYKWLNPR